VTQTVDVNGVRCVHVTQNRSIGEESELILMRLGMASLFQFLRRLRKENRYDNERARGEGVMIPYL
jgi:hypothetical protein